MKRVGKHTCAMVLAAALSFACGKVEIPVIGEVADGSQSTEETVEEKEEENEKVFPPDFERFTDMPVMKIYTTSGTGVNSKEVSDPAFKAKVIERFNYFYDNQEAIFNYIDQYASYLNPYVAKNEAVWKIMNKYVWPNPKIYGSFGGEVNAMKSFLRGRFGWIKDNIEK